jgi:hypothetical protein
MNTLKFARLRTLIVFYDALNIPLLSFKSALHQKLIPNNMLRFGSLFWEPTQEFSNEGKEQPLVFAFQPPLARLRRLIKDRR